MKLKQQDHEESSLFHLSTNVLRYCKDEISGNTIDRKLCFKIMVADLLWAVMVAKAKSDMQNVRIAK